MFHLFSDKSSETFCRVESVPIIVIFVRVSSIKSVLLIITDQFQLLLDVVKNCIKSLLT